MLRIASEAARVIMEVYGRPFDVDYKGPQDPVTEADRRANALICERLEQEFPGVPIVAEESDESAFANFRDADRVFFVDPVDGTREFVDRNGEFAVMIGLLEGNVAIDRNIRVRVAPGHTPWLQIPVIETPQGTVAFLADLVPTTSHIRYPYIMAYDLEPLATEHLP